MGFFIYFSVPLICTILFRRFIRQPTASLFLEGLAAYMPRTAAIPTPPPGTKTSKRDKKLLQRRQVQLKEAQSYLIVQQLSPSALHYLSSEPSTFGENFETLGILLLVLFTGVVTHFTLGPLLGLWQEVLLYTLGPLVVAWAACQLLLLECGGALRRLAGDRLHVAALAAAAAVAAYGILVALPEGVLRWDVRAAAPDFDKLYNGGLTRLYAARMRQYQPPPPLTSDPHQIAAALAVVAGVIAAALLSPCARMAKLYSYLSPVPQWAEKYLSPHPLAAIAVRLALALPLVVVLYGIRPMSEFWGVSPAVLAAAGPVLVAAAAVAQVLAVRPLAGAHLGGGLLEWHLLRHEAGGGGGGGSTATAAGSTAAGAGAGASSAREMVLRKRLTLVYATVCQVALQLLAPAAIMVCLALLYGSASGSLDAFRPSTPLLLNLNSRSTALPAAMPPSPPPSPLSPPLTQAPSPTSPPLSSSADGSAALLEGLDEGSVVAAAASAVEAAVGAVRSAAGAAAAVVSGGELPPMPPLDFVRFAAGFLAWWCCAVSCLFTYPVLFVYRAGLHVG